MTDNGKVFPIIPFNLIVDTDIGLIQVISKKYHDNTTFYKSLLDADIRYQIYLLYSRLRINPLTAIAKDRDNKELMDTYYNQFMEEEYVDILKNSVFTRIENVIIEGLNIQSIFPIILCSSEIEKQFLLKRNKEIYEKCTIYIDTPYSEVITEDTDPIYLKNIMDLIPLINVIEGKNVYIPRYRFNYHDSEKTLLKPAPYMLSSGLVRIETFDLYKDKEDMIVGK